MEEDKPEGMRMMNTRVRITDQEEEDKIGMVDTGVQLEQRQMNGRTRQSMNTIEEEDPDQEEEEVEEGQEDIEEVEGTAGRKNMKLNLHLLRR